MSENKKFYITTAIAYTSRKPHIGNAYDIVLADISEIRGRKYSNPVTFLQDGCPIINVSKMSDIEFLNLVKRIESINHRKYNIKFYC